jgi:SAM-dependent methyltransferase
MTTNAPLPSSAPPEFLSSGRPDLQDPPWTHSLAYISRALPRGLAALVTAAQLRGDARVADYGCASMPYRSFFPAAADYVGIDLPGNPQARLHLQPDGTVPTADGGFDLVLSSQVLEHVSDPALYLRECYRMLRPGGQLILSTHGIMVYHRDPVDYWRWTGEGLDRIVRLAGFEVEQFTGIMGLAPTGLQLFQDATYGHVPRWLRPAFVWCLQKLIAWFDRLHSPQSRAVNALVFALRARKPLPVEGLAT